MFHLPSMRMIDRVQPLVFLIAWVAAPAFGQDVATGDPVLAFESELHEDIREGYVALKWNAVPSAAAYRVISSDAELVYQGYVNQAFLSGLSDGTFEYRVEAMSSSGTTIATSAPTTVIVNHWSLRQALILFAIGLIVVLSLVTALYCGARQTNRGSVE